MSSLNIRYDILRESVGGRVVAGFCPLLRDDDHREVRDVL